MKGLVTFLYMSKSFRQGKNNIGLDEKMIKDLVKALKIVFENLRIKYAA